ncbi:MAG: SPOR domain-containing protein [Xanthomonadales bacterium]|nr:SPOR domain-containing protein [Xanthomonadales bacterium]
MFWRVALLFLIAANLALAAWLRWAPAPPLPPPGEEGIPLLRLLAERRDPPPAAEPSPPAAELATAPEPLAALPVPRCFSLGPIASRAELGRVAGLLAPLVAELQVRERLRAVSRGHAVFLPAFPSRAEALAAARRLAALGIRDYYVVTSGEQENTISLGLFRDPAAAERRRAQLAGLGFEARVRERIEEETVFFLDLAEDRGATVDWRVLVPPALKASAEPVPCPPPRPAAGG